MSTPSLTPEQFIRKWQAISVNEMAGYQEHFKDICRLIGEETPLEADPTGETYAFQKGAEKTDGKDGWADVWKQGCFAWEYKGKHKDLKAALKQVQQYSLALGNPPVLVTCDLETIVLTTNFNYTVTQHITILLKDIGLPANLDRLRWLFREPERLKPGETRQQVTEKAAQAIAKIAESLRKRAPAGISPEDIAQFLNKLVFCLFAQDVDLLPSKIITGMIQRFYKQFKPNHLSDALHALFEQMAEGGLYGADEIDRFNGDLFVAGPFVRLDIEEAKILFFEVAGLDWSQIDPAIFGTLFERGLDPAKRSQLGAHYTNPESIQRIIGPVLVEPLETEWLGTRTQIEARLTEAQGATGKKQKDARLAAQALLEGFLARLHALRVLDPACGSGNFLYLSLRALKDLQHRGVIESEKLGLKLDLKPDLHGVGIHNVLGIELNPYAAALARMTIWIGEIQWLREHGRPVGSEPGKPVLNKLEHIQCRDALVNEDGSEASWPDAECVVGNPPFLGDKKMLRELGDEYVGRLRKCYDGRVPGGADLVCHWFDKARSHILAGKAKRAGFVSTNSIRGGKNRVVLDKMLVDGLVIFDAWSDEAWFDKGASVRVSMVAFAQPVNAGPVRLDGIAVAGVNADLTGGLTTDVTAVRRLPSNIGVSFLGDQKNGPFDVDGEIARKWLVQANPHGKTNADVLHPVVNGAQLIRRAQDIWRIDFGPVMAEADAALYESPFEHVVQWVKPVRASVRRDAYRVRWWIHAEPRPAMRLAIGKLKRFIATPTVSKHRIAAWLDSRVLPDHQLVAIARDDDTSFGILHSRAHELWSLRLCTWLGVGNDPRYTPSTTFETFPFPAGLEPDRPAADYAADPNAQAIAAAAKKLVELRDRWLNPPEWTERIDEVVPGYPQRIVVKAGHDEELKKRTLTQLYNKRPTWLADAHKALDAAVLAAYGWPVDLEDEEILRRLLALNLERAAGQGAAVVAIAEEAEPAEDE